MEQDNRPKSGKNQNIILENRERLSVSGVEEVIHFDDTTVILHTALGELSIQGEKLKVESLQVDNGELFVSGNVCALSYAAESTGWWERLFG